jgi:hypothetical protein
MTRNQQFTRRQKVRQMASEGLSAHVIAERFRLTLGGVYRICREGAVRFGRPRGEPYYVRDAMTYDSDFGPAFR